MEYILGIGEIVFFGIGEIVAPLHWEGGDVAVLRSSVGAGAQWEVTAPLLQ